ncbi:lysosomal cobalamin transport escort protein LMBD1 [Caerostris darwini]|uniref:Lysosomal cobalamin transport escort protein LMBD1 n=1 Tax=Caerostris darwini TaxID=1538125 RepID=A0AAV4TZ33_9ARAC|nr:lysosomal cobalamin transport escort protein LMBD1 [Caerostris darwini]
MDLSEEIINLPSFVAAYGWIPFVVAIVLSILFSALYVKKFWYKSERDSCSAIIAIVGISFALLSACLLPVDVFLVSFMKNSDGSFKDWANNSTRQALEDSVSYTYYSLYGIVFFYTFFILPLAYFSYEEKDDDHGSTFSVLTTALMYTVVFLVVITGLLLAGAFIPYKAPPMSNNSTEWNKIEFLVKELYKNKGKDAFSFVMNVLTVYGMLNIILYTSSGLASFPITLIKGFRSLSEEESVISRNQASTQSKINDLRSKQQTRKALSSREIAALADLEEEESLLSKRSALLEYEKKSILNKCQPFFRIFHGICGCIGISFSLILFVSLLVTNIDKLMNSLGYHMGYILKQNMLPNIMDYIMVEAQKVFPLDYILFFLIILFLVICTVSGMRFLGICCLCVPMYKVRPKKTPPQALIMLAFILMFVVLAFNIFMYSVIPTYTTFGSQYYCKEVNGTCGLTACTLDASADDCVMTRAGAFILSFAYKAWIFAAAYYWLTWVFLIAFVFSFIHVLIRGRRSALEEAIDKDDFDDSDDHMLSI